MLDYLEGELNEKIYSEFKKHLNACPQCQKDLTELTQTRQKIGRALKIMAGKANLPVSSEEKIRQQLSAQIVKKKTSWVYIPGGLRWQKVFALAAALLIISLGLFLTMLPHQSLEAKVTAIATADQRLQSFLEDKKVVAIQVSITNKDQGLFLLVVEKNEDFQEMQLVVDVAIKKEQVRRIEKYSPSPLTEKEKELALAIAQSNHEVKNLLAQGFVIKDTMSAFPPLGQEPIGENIYSRRFAKIILKKKRENNHWVIRIDLTAKQVIAISESFPNKAATKIKWGEGKVELWDDHQGGGVFNGKVEYGKNEPF
jgi:hypothetical protein